jgi:lipoate-protein ligase A
MIEGRKVSGAATTSTAISFLHQGTLILEDAATEMAHALGAPLDTMRSAVTSLADVGVRIAPDILQKDIAQALAAAFGLDPVVSSVTDMERASAQREFDREIGSDANAFGHDLLLNAGARA